jgi:hypothetical protein
MKINMGSMHQARVTGPISYLTSGGKRSQIPIGPCLVEQIDGQSVDIIWGARGRSSAALPLAEIEAAEDHGNLVVLD